MANEYTSAATAGFGTNTLITAYDFAFDLVYRETPMYRTWTDKRPERPNGPGSTIRLQKQDWFGSATVTAQKTPLTEESDVDSTKLPATTFVDLQVNEYGGAVTRTLWLQTHDIFNVDEAAVRATAGVAADVVDELVQDKLVSGSNVIRAQGRAATNLVTATDYLRATDIRKAVTKLRKGLSPAWGGGMYAGGIHPDALHDLREETGSGSWRVPAEYGTNGPNNMIWNGEFGAFEGVRFVQNVRNRNATDGASSARVYRTFIQGRQAIAESAVIEPHIVLSPQTDKLRRFQSVGWHTIIGFALYRPESLVRLESSSSTAAL